MAQVDITRIAGNIQALNALNSLSRINSKLAMHQERLATGKRILSASDDPAGMSIATTFKVRAEGMQTALNSIGDSKNMLSSMEGGLKQVEDILVKMRNKALEANGDTLGANEKQAIYEQVQAYRDEINDIVSQTEWNGTDLLGGNDTASINLDFLTDADGGTTRFGFSGGTSIFSNQSFFSDAAGGSASSVANPVVTLDSIDAYGVAAVTAGQTELDSDTYSVVVTGGGANFQVQDSDGNAVSVSDGAGGWTSAAQAIADGAFDTGRGLTITFDIAGTADGSNTVDYTALSTVDLGLADASLNVTTDAATALSTIDQALDVVKEGISQVGAFSARLSFKEEALTVAHANVEAAHNRIMNANMAQEQVEASKYSILQQTATAMLSNANVAPQVVLSLFR
ncbi:MAG: hypothetical protein DWQ07_05295 [Chloroflexi bacterium]|nr:MAG: hypothetical protein DWQ07_05295 [Chloroflexota bacterium]